MCEAISGTKKKKECLKDKLSNLIQIVNNNIWDLYSDTEFKKGYQPRTNLVKDETGDLLADTHSIFNRRG
jgi:hypothetical protein